MHNFLRIAVLSARLIRKGAAKGWKNVHELEKLEKLSSIMIPQMRTIEIYHH